MFRSAVPLHGGRRRPVDPYAVILLVQLGRQIASLPPGQRPIATLAMMGLNALPHFSHLLPPELSRLVPSIGAGCLQPAAILEGRQWGRLLWSPFLHGDDVHLYYNMASLLAKGLQLEGRLGPLRFTVLTAWLLVLSQALYVGVAAGLAAAIPEYRWTLYGRTCAVGFSGVLFALKVVLTWGAPGTSTIWGVPLPTKYLAWGELVAASLVTPNASFFGHLMGVAAGLLHCAYVRPALARLREGRQAAQRAWARQTGAARPRFAAGSGGASGGSSSWGGRPGRAGQPASPAAAAAGAGAGRQQQPRPEGEERAAAPPPSMEELRQRRLHRLGVA